MKVTRLMAVGWCWVFAGTVSAEASPELELARQLNRAFVEVAEQVSPSVVVIRVSRRETLAEQERRESPLWDLLPHPFRRYLDSPSLPETKPQANPGHPGLPDPSDDGQGSGIILREDGYLLTNFHVVEDAEQIRVRLKNGKTYPARLQGADPQSDIAVLKIDATGLAPARLGDSSKTRVGEFAIAIGAPFELEYSVTVGHVSAKGRSHILPGLAEITPYPVTDQDYLQTDASINPGNSGGPLVNLYGEVIGINTLIRGLRTGIGFAVPINLAREVAETLIKDGKFTRAWLGVVILSLRDYDEFREWSGVDQGVVIKEVPPGTPAAQSELRPGDVVVAVEGVRVGTSVELKGAMRSKKIGEAVRFDVLRGNPAGGLDKKQITVRPGPWPDPGLSLARPEKPLPATVADWGLTTETLTPVAASKHAVEFQPGVLVTRIEYGSFAAARGVRFGDIITAVNHRPVTNTKEYNQAVKAADLRKGVLLHLISKGTRRIEILRQSE